MLVYIYICLPDDTFTGTYEGSYGTSITCIVYCLTDHEQRLKIECFIKSVDIFLTVNSDNEMEMIAAINKYDLK